MSFGNRHVLGSNQPVLGAGTCHVLPAGRAVFAHPFQHVNGPKHVGADSGDGRRPRFAGVVLGGKLETPIGLDAAYGLVHRVAVLDVSFEEPHSPEEVPDALVAAAPSFETSYLHPLAEELQVVCEMAADESCDARYYYPHVQSLNVTASSPRITLSPL